MPIVNLRGEPCRVRPMLDAIGAQEALEGHCIDQQRATLAGPSAVRRWERERMALANRRNATEKKLTPSEHAAWEYFRKGDRIAREVMRAILTDTDTP